MKFAEYKYKDEKMPDCTICLITFAPDDDIVVYECDPKHYFHRKCGLEWLQTKADCPLCRQDFSKQILKIEMKTKNMDDLRTVARETAL